MGSLRGGAPREGGSLPPPNIRHAARIPAFARIDQNMLEYVLQHPKNQHRKDMDLQTASTSIDFKAFGYQGNAIRSKMTLRTHF